MTNFSDKYWSLFHPLRSALLIHTFQHIYRYFYCFHNGCNFSHNYSISCFSLSVVGAYPKIVLIFHRLMLICNVIMRFKIRVPIITFLLLDLFRNTLYFISKGFRWLTRFYAFSESLFPGSMIIVVTCSIFWDMMILSNKLLWTFSAIFFGWPPESSCRWTIS